MFIIDGIIVIKTILKIVLSNPFYLIYFFIQAILKSKKTKTEINASQYLDCDIDSALVHFFAT